MPIQIPKGEDEGWIFPEPDPGMPWGLTAEEQERWREEQRRRNVRPVTKPRPLPARTSIDHAVEVADDLYNEGVIEGEFEVPVQVIVTSIPFDEKWYKGDVLKYRHARPAPPTRRLGRSRAVTLFGLDRPVYEPTKWVVVCVYRKPGHALRSAILKSLPEDDCSHLLPARWPPKQLPG